MDRVRIFDLEQKTHTDPRGWVLFPFQAGLDRRPKGCDPASLHAARTEPGRIRGNHRHPDSAEWLHVFGGCSTLYWEEDGQVRAAVLEKEYYLIYIPAGVAHAIKNTGATPSWLIAFREGPSRSLHTLDAPIV